MKRNFFTANRFIHHFIFWILFFAGWYLLRYQAFASKSIAVQLTAIKVIDLAVMVYISNYVLVPKLLYKKEYVLFGACYVLLVFCFSILKMKIEGLIMHDTGIFSANFKGRIYDNIIPHFLLVSTGVAFKLIIDHNKAQKRIRDIAKEKTEAELNFLKAQINPHFIFNALNSVYFLIDSKNQKARNALHTFSEMLRYQLYETRNNAIAIEKEISFLKDYIDVQRLRKNNNLEITFNVNLTNKTFCIQPLLLIPFVENAFKHLSHNVSNEKDIIAISISEKNSVLDYTVENTTDDSNTKYINNTQGIGLNNVKRRLELLYPEKHRLHIEHNNHHFKINLTLQTA